MLRYFRTDYVRMFYDRRDIGEARSDLAAWIKRWQGEYPKAQSSLSIEIWYNVGVLKKLQGLERCVQRNFGVGCHGSRN